MFRMASERRRSSVLYLLVLSSSVLTSHSFSSATNRNSAWTNCQSQVQQQEQNSAYVKSLSSIIAGSSRGALTSSLGRSSSALSMSASSSASPSTPVSVATIPSWKELQDSVGQTAVGKALNSEVQVRATGKGSPHVQSTLRLFNSDKEPLITLYRDHAGWCPYCQKTMLLIEEKEVPIKISLVPMRSYGDKPREFLQKVPSGLLPAITVKDPSTGREQVITESQVIMELLDQWHSPEEGYRPMIPSTAEGFGRYERLARLERELFSWWCTLVFRPEGPRLGGGGGNPISRLFGASGGDSAEMSSSMKGFLDCMRKVDQELLSTKGPWFFDRDGDHEFNYPTMIDFIFVSHVERMLASCAYWKGLNLRDPKWVLNGLNRWLEAFEKREAYVAFKSDYFTHVMDIPPQYGPGCDGGFEEDRIKFVRSIIGRDGKSWNLPLDFDDSLQPLYKGIPLPSCALQAVGLEADANGSYQSSDPEKMEVACRTMAAWKLAGNGVKVAKFAARGGPKGGKNPRKSFGAQLADPYAEADSAVQPHVDTALRVVCQALLLSGDKSDEAAQESLKSALQAAIPAHFGPGVQSSLEYVRDRVGVPRDLPLAAARYFRAYLNWAIDALDR